MVENALRKHAPCAVSVKSVCAYAAANGGDPRRAAGAEKKTCSPAGSQCAPVPGTPGSLVL